MQYIQEDGAKRFAKDSRKEGYATAATNAEALGFVTNEATENGMLQILEAIERAA